MHCELLGQPCRNFQILGIAAFTDPRDGREKAVLSNFAAGAVGNIVIVDPLTGEGEDLALPGDNGAWAVLNWRDEKLLIGTCGQYGYLHCLDLESRRWAEPLRDEKEQYIWNLCLGEDGLVYGGTYPGCVLLRYDPARHALENLGRVSEVEGNLYSRMVYGGIPGHILIACGYAQTHLALWEIRTGKARRFGRPGAGVREVGADFLCTQVGEELDFYDLGTLEPLGEDLRHRLRSGGPPARYQGMGFSVQLEDGRYLCTRGQEYYLEDGVEQRPPLRPIPAPRPATRIHTLTSDAQGKLWGSAGFGQTIFSFDPRTGETWNSQVVCDSGGEVYGMAFADGQLFMSCYSGGDHVVYDPAQPWNQVDHLNPRTLRAAGPALIRPSGRSLIGPDGHFWTGWMAAYGRYGGGLSRVRVDSLEVEIWTDPLGPQALMGLAADPQYLYLITGGGANGLPPQEGPFCFAVWDPEKGLVWQRAFPRGAVLHSVAAAGARVLVGVDSRLEIFDPQALSFEGQVELPGSCQLLVSDAAGKVLAFCGKEVGRVVPQDHSFALLGKAPGVVSAAVATPRGVYCAIGTELHRLSA
jgi:streptogramin lyase